MSVDPSFGLSALPAAVARTVATTYGHHRTPWFEQILQDIAERLRPALGDRFTPLFLTCTPLGAREAAVANLVRPGDHVLATEGDFAGLARAWGAQVETIPAVSTEFVPDAVLIEHVSPSYALHDLAELTAQARKAAPEAPIVLDASISFGVDLADLNDCGADAVILAPERGLMGIPGVTIFAVTDDFMEIVAHRRPALAEKPFLFDLARYHRSWAKHTTPYSPNISACIALQAALEHIDADGGLLALPERHRERAERIRAQAIARGCQLLAVEGSSTNAFTPLAIPHDADAADVLGNFSATGIEARQSGPSTILLAHAGYAPENPVPAPSAQPPFTIAPAEFLEQVRKLLSRSTLGEDVRERIFQSARRVFQDRHIVHEDALRHRVVGFVGAGRIVTRAVELCARYGVQSVKVYAPSLTNGERAREWSERGVEVSPSLEDLFTSCHTIVLLPVVYDERALTLFRKPREYFNRGLVSAALLEQAESAGRLDLLINAAARGALVDRPALAQAVGAGWLRYYSDELPAADDPLPACDEVRYTAHVGGSCRAPQAAVARNTHKILRQLVATLRGLQDPPSDYTPNVVNAHLLGEAAGTRRDAAAREIADSGRIRILLTDPFDISSMAFERLRDLGVEPDVHDVSAGPMSTERLVAALEQVRPNVVMLRSRTRVDASAARAMAGIDGLAYVIRPGVGVDNLHDGLQLLSESGIQIINEPYGNSGAVAEMTMHFILSGTETTIFAPGPTKFHPDVFDVAASYDEARTSTARTLVDGIGRDLGDWLGARRQAIVLSGPGTALMEASIASLSAPGARGLVLSHGKFGDRFVQIARARGRGCEVLQVPEEEWGAAIAPEAVERFLQEDRRQSPPISFLCFQQNETSSGVTYHQESIRALVQAARAYNPSMMIIADAISGALAHRLDFDALDLDALFLGSQKALGVSSGLAFGVLSDRALAWMTERCAYTAGFDGLCEDPSGPLHLDTFDRLQRVHSISLLRAAVAARKGFLLDTPSVFHLLSTAKALDMFRAEGGRERVFRRHSELARLVRQGVRGLGLRVMPAAPFESDSVTVVILPLGLDASAIRKRIARHTGIAVAGAQGDYWKPRMLRIGTLGFTTRADVVRCLRALRVALTETGYARANESAALIFK